jgi:hypothetical protein
VAFYNRRDKNPEQFGAPDVIENVNREELGKLGMTDAEENDVVAFLETLSDGYVANRPSQSEPEFPATAPSVGSQDHFRSARDYVRVVRFRTDMSPPSQPSRPPR